MQNEADVFKELCENDFAFYAKHFVKVLEPETEFEWNWHMDEICHYCERVYYGYVSNLDINIPPRMLKSIIVSVLFPTWVWTKDQSKKFICGSRSFELSIQFSVKRRDIIESEAYQSLWPIKLRGDTNTAKKFANKKGGFMQAVSALGKIVGSGADILISDDLLDTIDAFSKTKRDAVCRWFSQAFYNRVQSKKKAKRININQRLHLKDVSGHIASEHNYKTLIIPMLMTEVPLSTVPGFVDPRAPGEFIHPARYDQKEMDDEYKSLGVYGWSAQMQQSPKPIGGGIIKKEWIRYYDPMKTPGFSRRVITADLSFKGLDDSDYVCFQAWGETSDKKKYLIDIVRGHWSYKQTKENFKLFCAKHNIWEKHIEDKANGPALISDFESEIPGLKAWPAGVNAKYAKASKVQRLHMVSQDFEMGEVYVPTGITLVDEYVEELLSFTERGSTTGNDDMVDTSTMALLEFKRPITFFAG